ncbi:MAG TPA: phytanoyl-CoA dioxygenase family protein [Aliidongia sp.]|nr:phytanoyl-CoA dioxygenase family protein [Aliidongia sp.]
MHGGNQHVTDLLSPSPVQTPEAADLCRRVRDRAERGDLLGAIAMGHAVHRELQDPVLERYLVALRAAAFATLPVSARPAPPPAPVDPFPGQRGVPEIDGRDLTPAILAGSIRHHGSLLVRGLFDPAAAADLRRDVDRAFAAQTAFKAGAAVEDTGPWYARVEALGALGYARPFTEDNDGIWTADSPRVFHRLIDLFERQGLIDLVGAVLGERPAMSIGKSTLRRVGPGIGTDWWHQDGAFLGAGIRALNIWLALSPCGTDAPGLDVFAGRLDTIVPTGTDGAHFDWSVGRTLVDRLAAEGAEIASPVFAPGDALLFDEMMLHCTGVRPGMTGTRWAIETWFFAPSSFPMEQVPLVL